MESIVREIFGRMYSNHEPSATEKPSVAYFTILMWKLTGQLGYLQHSMFYISLIVSTQLSQQSAATQLICVPCTWRMNSLRLLHNLIIRECDERLKTFLSRKLLCRTQREGQPIFCETINRVEHRRDSTSRIEFSGTAETEHTAWQYLKWSRLLIKMTTQSKSVMVQLRRVLQSFTNMW